jgi:hypothetical protein
MTKATLYERDYVAWTEEQGRRLREAGQRKINLDLDFENLAEEVESMGRSETRSMNSALIRVIEHLLKLAHSPAEAPRAGWRQTIVTQRGEALEEIETSPSLRQKIDLARLYARGRKQALVGLEADGLGPRDLPETCPFTLEQILDEEWWPDRPA